MSDPSKLACFCNRVTWEQVDRAVQEGAKDLPSLYDACQAGSGPCGGSCQQALQRRILEFTKPEAPVLFQEETPPEVVQAVSLFNRRYYWETHEVLEDIWMDENGPRRMFYQGLIQAAAALYHVLNANPKGVIRLAEEGARKLTPYLPTYLGIGIQELKQVLDHYAQESRDILAGSKVGFDYDRLPMLRISVPEVKS